MPNENNLLRKIKESVNASEPNAILILYGSYARGSQKEDSDVDILILIDKDTDKITYTEECKITHPLYAIEFETGVIISPLIYTKKQWANPRVTPFYENVIRDGKLL